MLQHRVAHHPSCNTAASLPSQSLVIKEKKKKEVEKKSAGIALKSTKEESDSSEEDEEKEMAMFAKRFKRLMKSNRGRRFQRREDFMNKNKEEEKDQLIFFECKKPGHIKVECPNLKKKSFEKKKHKSYVATWSDEETSDDEDYVANLCLMAIEDDSMVTSNSSISIDYTFNELQEAYDELVLVCEESMIKNRKTISKLKVENDSLSKTNKELESLETIQCGFETFARLGCIFRFEVKGLETSGKGSETLRLRSRNLCERFRNPTGRNTSSTHFSA
ncbi:hypothetical protein V6N13_033598 [Hibiscus sabdariffa]